MIRVLGVSDLLPSSLLLGASYLDPSDGDELFRYDGSEMKLALDLDGVGETGSILQSPPTRLGSSFSLDDFTDWSGEEGAPSIDVTVFRGSFSDAKSHLSSAGRWDG